MKEEKSSGERYFYGGVFWLIVGFFGFAITLLSENENLMFVPMCLFIWGMFSMGLGALKICHRALGRWLEGEEGPEPKMIQIEFSGDFDDALKNLEKLQGLRERGAVSEEEYQSIKNEVLRGMRRTP